MYSSHSLLIMEGLKKKNVETENKRTLESNKSEQQNINKDGKGNNGQYKKQGKNKKQTQKNEKKYNNSLSFLDISI